MLDLKDIEINKLKIFVTTDCNMSCNYCMIKNTGEYMQSEVAIKGIDKYIFNSKSDNQKKFIYFFGGEPLLNFSTIKKVVDYVNIKKANYDFNIEYVICTNFTIVSDEILYFIEKNNINLSISIGGKKHIHNSHRIFNYNQKSDSFKITENNINNLINKTNIPIEKIGVGFVIPKNQIGEMYNNFIFIVEELGLKHINFELVIDKKEWGISDYIIFKELYIKIIKYILLSIQKKKYIYLNNINWAIVAYKNNYDKSNEHAFKYLSELYPNGDITFSGFFSHIEKKHKMDIIIENILEDKLNIDKQELFDENFMNDYFSKIDNLNNFNPGDGYFSIKKFMKNMDERVTEYILSNSNNSSIYKEYIDKVQEIYY